MAEPAYRYDDQALEAAPLRPATPGRPPLRVMPKPSGQPDAAARPAGLPRSMLVSLVLAVLILASAVFTNIFLVNGTMRLMVVSNHLEQDIKTGRSDGHSLESLYSGLTNPQRIQGLAVEQGMVLDPAPEYLSVIDGPPASESASDAGPEAASASDDSPMDGPQDASSQWTAGNQ